MFQEEKSNNKSILVSIVVLVVLAIAGAAWFWLKNNRAPVEATITQVELMPLHQQYGHVFGHVGADQTEDIIYVLARVTIHNHNDAAPAFLKDFSVKLSAKDDAEADATAVTKDDLANLLKAFPQMQQIAHKLGDKPLLTETEVPRNASADGYLVFPFQGTPAIWNERKQAVLRVDMYHNAFVTTAFPK